MDQLPEYIAIFDDVERPRAHWRYEDVSYISDRYKILALDPRGRHPYSWTNDERIDIYEAHRPPVTMASLSRNRRLPLREHYSPQLRPRFAIFLQENTQPVMMIWWETQFQVYYQAKRVWIPVIGFMEPHKIMHRYLYEAEDDTEYKCKSREMLQQTERMRIMDMLRYLSIPRDVDLDLLRWAMIGIRPRRSYTESDEELSDEEDLREAIRRSLNPRPPSPEMVRAPRPRPRTAPAPAATPAPSAPAAPAPKPKAEAAPPPPFAPKFVLELLKKEATAKGESCPISMTPFAECQGTTATSCFHLFDTASITHWLTSHKTCPVCKQDVKSTVVV